MSARAKPELADLERAIGHVFADRALLRRALTHVSALDDSRRIDSYQRLEFLGDRVLGLIVADMVYRSFPDDPEGAMSRRLATLVRKETCAEVAQQWGTGPHILLGPGERQSGGRRRLTTLGDVCEALIGAVYLDGGLEAARSVIGAAWSSRLENDDGVVRDAKTALQEWAQARGLRTPTYHTISRSGPDHDPRFVVAVEVEGHEPAEATGKSKRFSEQGAAEAFMRREGIGRE